MYVVLYAPGPGDDDNDFSGTSVFGPFVTEHDAWVLAESLVEESGGDNRHIGVAKVVAFEAEDELI